MGSALVESSGTLLRQVRAHTFARRAWIAMSTATAAVLGLLPHILHHVGPLAGAALFAGATGSLLFGVLGFLAALPFLRRVRRRYGNWRVPLGILTTMVVVFSLSTFVVGPAITGADENDGNTPSQSTPGRDKPSGHDTHH